VGTIVSVEPGDAWTDVRVSLPADLARYLVPKGSICIDGVSLTVVSVTDAAAPAQPADDSSVPPPAASFTVSLIPTTLARTTLGLKGPGALVNLEVDVIAKYVQRLLRPGGAETDHRWE